VFLEDTAFLTWLNIFHATTRPRIIEQEILWRRGMPFDRQLVEETMRNLREQLNYSVVAAIPITPMLETDPDQVDMLVVTRDTWSLRASTDLDFADDTITRLYIALTERNLAGLHKSIAAVFVYEPDTIQLGPLYEDPRIGGTRLTVREQFGFFLNHETWEMEGTTNTIELGLPLYSLDARWGFRVGEYHDISIDRFFIGSQLRTYDNPDTAEVEEVPFEIDSTEIEAVAEGFYSLGRSIKHVFTFGWGLTVDEFDLVDDSVDSATRAAFRRDILPIDETASFASFGYQFYRAEYRTLANLQTFAFSEDVRVGHELVFETDLAPTFLGSDRDFIRTAALAGYTWVVSDAYLSGEIEGGARWNTGGGGEALVDRYGAARFRLISPVLGFLRLHLGADGLLQFQRVSRQLNTLGGDSGLRGYPAGAFIGESIVLGHFEARTLPIEFLTTYLGLVTFFDAGAIFDEGEDPDLLSDVGLGVRLLVPQLQRTTYRFDYAFPTSGPDSFFPGVFTVGVGQVF
jgi:hypothetical protein